MCVRVCVCHDMCAHAQAHVHAYCVCCVWVCVCVNCSKEDDEELANYILTSESKF